jgi:hypothetical protein
MNVYPRNASPLVSFFIVQTLEGLRQDRDVAIPLQYTRCPSAGIDDDDDQWESDEDDPFHILCMQWMKICHLQEQLLLRTKDFLQGNLLPSPSFFKIEPFITYEKRRRSSNWEPPEHIPDFLHFQSTQSLRTFSPIAINTARQCESVFRRIHYLFLSLLLSRFVFGPFPSSF